MQPDASLYMTFSNVISLQFFKNWFGLLPLENILNIPCLCVIESFPSLYPSFIDFLMNIFKSL